MIQRSKLGLKFFPLRFRRHVYLRDLSIVVMRDILQSRYMRRRVAHKQLAWTSLRVARGPDAILASRVLSNHNSTEAR